MKRFVLILFVFSLVISFAVGALATTVTIQRGGSDPLGTKVLDVNLRSDGMADWNGGTANGTGVRLLPDAGWPSTKGPRHELVGFDLSGIAAGSTITSATYGQWLGNSSGGDTITDFKISRLQLGATWVEGSGVQPAAAGDPTWSHRQFSTTAWGAAGATGAADIDLGTSITWGIVAGSGSGFRTFDITSWVQDWVNGTWANNGLLLWGGVGTSPGSTTHWWVGTSEDATLANRPYLTVDYTEAPVPEPSSLLAFGAFGIAGLGLIRRRRA